MRTGRINLSRILIPGHRMETGRKDLDSLRSLPGFGRGIIMELFQMVGIWQVSSDRLKICVRYSKLKVPRYFRCKFDMPSGPIALEALDFLIASLV